MAIPSDGKKRRRGAVGVRRGGALLLLMTAVLMAALAMPWKVARADIAPPKTPPGTTLLPGQEQTQVRMVAEVVTLTVSKDSAHPDEAMAKTDAVFTMRNLGTTEEDMAVRFPLSFFDGSSDGRSAFPEIPSLSARVNGKSVTTKRELQPPYDPSPYGSERPDVPWAVFNVAFPPGQDVSVGVTYTVRSYGYFPQAIFDYVLQTGAAWKGTIGSADIIVQLPYEASESNVLLSENSRASGSTPGGEINGNEIRWHYSELEPTPADNFEVTLVTPSVWQAILKGQAAVKSNPKDGEAWGMLGKAYKQAALLPKGWTRDDPAGQQLIQLSENAYQRCLALLPKDALWHYGYADMLWSDFYFNVYSEGKPDTNGLLPRALTELKASLAFDPSNQQAKDLLDWIGGSVPGVVNQTDGTYDYLGLTATPTMRTLYELTPLVTEQPATSTPPTQAASVATARSAPTAPPRAGNPLCGGGFLLFSLPGLGLLLRLRRGAATEGR